MLKKIKEIEKNRLPSNYLSTVDKKLEKIEEKIASVILFGSFARGDNTQISDVDLLIVFKDNAPNTLISGMDKTLTKIENKYDYIEQPEGLLEKLIYSLKRKTGMFVSHFVCKEEDIRKRNFSKMFSTEKFFSSLIAPADLVLNNMGEDGIALYGKPLNKSLKKSIKIGSMVKSLFMNLLTALGSAVISPFYKKTTELSTEAVKWSLLATHQFLTQQSGGVNEAIKFLKKHDIYTSETLEEFKSLRNRLRENPLFIFKVLPLIIKMHFEAIKHRGI